jgi:hypothetical protein
MGITAKAATTPITNQVRFLRGAGCPFELLLAANRFIFQGAASTTASFNLPLWRLRNVGTASQAIARLDAQLPAPDAYKTRT